MNRRGRFYPIPRGEIVNQFNQSESINRRPNPQRGGYYDHQKFNRRRIFYPKPLMGLNIQHYERRSVENAHHSSEEYNYAGIKQEYPHYDAGEMHVNEEFTCYNNEGCTSYDNFNRNTSYDNMNRNTSYDNFNRNTSYDNINRNTSYDSINRNASYDNINRNTNYDNINRNTNYDNMARNEGFGRCANMNRNEGYACYEERNRNEEYACYDNMVDRSEEYEGYDNTMRRNEENPDYITTCDTDEEYFENWQSDCEFNDPNCSADYLTSCIRGNDVEGVSQWTSWLQRTISGAEVPPNPRNSFEPPTNHNRNNQRGSYRHQHRRGGSNSNYNNYSRRNYPGEERRRENRMYRGRLRKRPNSNPSNIRPGKGSSRNQRVSYDDSEWVHWDDGDTSVDLALDILHSDAKRKREEEVVSEEDFDYETAINLSKSDNEEDLALETAKSLVQSEQVISDEELEGEPVVIDLAKSDSEEIVNEDDVVYQKAKNLVNAKSIEIEEDLKEAVEKKNIIQEQICSTSEGNSLDTQISSTTGKETLEKSTKSELNKDETLISSTSTEPQVCSSSSVTSISSTSTETLIGSNLQKLQKSSSGTETQICSGSNLEKTAETQICSGSNLEKAKTQIPSNLVKPSSKLSNAKLLSSVSQKYMKVEKICLALAKHLRVELDCSNLDKTETQITTVPPPENTDSETVNDLSMTTPFDAAANTATPAALPQYQENFLQFLMQEKPEATNPNPNDNQDSIEGDPLEAETLIGYAEANTESDEYPFEEGIEYATTTIETGIEYETPTIEAGIKIETLTESHNLIAEAQTEPEEDECADSIRRDSIGVSTESEGSIRRDSIGIRTKSEDSIRRDSVEVRTEHENEIPTEGYLIKIKTEPVEDETSIESETFELGTKPGENQNNFVEAKAQPHANESSSEAKTKPNANRKNLVEAIAKLHENKASVEASSTKKHFLEAKAKPQENEISAEAKAKPHENVISAEAKTNPYSIRRNLVENETSAEAKKVITPLENENSVEVQGNTTPAFQVDLTSTEKLRLIRRNSVATKTQTTKAAPVQAKKNITPPYSTAEAKKNSTPTNNQNEWTVEATNNSNPTDKSGPSSHVKLIIRRNSVEASKNINENLSSKKNSVEDLKELTSSENENSSSVVTQTGSENYSIKDPRIQARTESGRNSVEDLRITTPHVSRRNSREDPRLINSTENENSLNSRYSVIRENTIPSENSSVQNTLFSFNRNSVITKNIPAESENLSMRTNSTIKEYEASFRRNSAEAPKKTYLTIKTNESFLRRPSVEAKECSNRRNSIETLEVSSRTSKTYEFPSRRNSVEPTQHVTVKDILRSSQKDWLLTGEAKKNINPTSTQNRSPVEVPTAKHNLPPVVQARVTSAEHARRVFLEAKKMPFKDSLFDKMYKTGTYDPPKKQANSMHFNKIKKILNETADEKIKKKKDFYNKFCSSESNSSQGDPKIAEGDKQNNSPCQNPNDQTRLIERAVWDVISNISSNSPSSESSAGTTMPVKTRQQAMKENREDEDLEELPIKKTVVQKPVAVAPKRGRPRKIKTEETTVSKPKKKEITEKSEKKKAVALKSEKKKRDNDKALSKKDSNSKVSNKQNSDTKKKDIDRASPVKISKSKESILKSVYLPHKGRKIESPSASPERETKTSSKSKSKHHSKDHKKSNRSDEKHKSSRSHRDKSKSSRKREAEDDQSAWIPKNRKVITDSTDDEEAMSKIHADTPDENNKRKHEKEVDVPQKAQKISNDDLLSTLMGEGENPDSNYMNDIRQAIRTFHTPTTEKDVPDLHDDTLDAQSLWKGIKNNDANAVNFCNRLFDPALQKKTDQNANMTSPNTTMAPSIFFQLLFNEFNKNNEKQVTTSEQIPPTVDVPKITTADQQTTSTLAEASNDLDDVPKITTAQQTNSTLAEASNDLNDVPKITTADQQTNSTLAEALNDLDETFSQPLIALKKETLEERTEAISLIENETCNLPPGVTVKTEGIKKSNADLISRILNPPEGGLIILENFDFFRIVYPLMVIIYTKMMLRPATEWGTSHFLDLEGNHDMSVEEATSRVDLILKRVDVLDFNLDTFKSHVEMHFKWHMAEFLVQAMVCLSGMSVPRTSFGKRFHEILVDACEKDKTSAFKAIDILRSYEPRRVEVLKKMLKGIFSSEQVVVISDDEEEVIKKEVVIQLNKRVCDQNTQSGEEVCERLPRSISREQTTVARCTSAQTQVGDVVRETFNVPQNATREQTEGYNLNESYGTSREHPTEPFNVPRNTSRENTETYNVAQQMNAYNVPRESYYYQNPQYPANPTNYPYPNQTDAYRYNMPASAHHLPIANNPSLQVPSLSGVHHLPIANNPSLQVPSLSSAHLPSMTTNQNNTIPSPLLTMPQRTANMHPTLPSIEMPQRNANIHSTVQSPTAQTRTPSVQNNPSPHVKQNNTGMKIPNANNIPSARMKSPGSALQNPHQRMTSPQKQQRPYPQMVNTGPTSLQPHGMFPARNSQYMASYPNLQYQHPQMSERCPTAPTFTRVNQNVSNTYAAHDAQGFDNYLWQNTTAWRGKRDKRAARAAAHMKNNQTQGMENELMPNLSQPSPVMVNTSASSTDEEYDQRMMPQLPIMVDQVNRSPMAGNRATGRSNSVDSGCLVSPILSEERLIKTDTSENDPISSDPDVFQEGKSYECICGKRADMLCECRKAIYCSVECQVSNWDTHSLLHLSNYGEANNGK